MAPLLAMSDLTNSSRSVRPTVCCFDWLNQTKVLHWCKYPGAKFEQHNKNQSWIYEIREVLLLLSGIRKKNRCSNSQTSLHFQDGNLPKRSFFNTITTVNIQLVVAHVEWWSWRSWEGLTWITLARNESRSDIQKYNVWETHNLTELLLCFPVSR